MADLHETSTTGVSRPKTNLLSFGDGPVSVHCDCGRRALRSLTRLSNRFFRVRMINQGIRSNLIILFAVIFYSS